MTKHESREGVEVACQGIITTARAICNGKEMREDMREARAREQMEPSLASECLQGQRLIIEAGYGGTQLDTQKELYFCR